MTLSKEQLELSEFRLTRGFPRHLHTDAIVVLMMSGAEVLAVDGNEIHAAAGTVLLIEPEQCHANWPAGGAATYCAFYFNSVASHERSGYLLGNRVIRDRRCFEQLYQLYTAVRHAQTGCADAIRELIPLFEDTAQPRPDALDYVSETQRLLKYSECPVPIDHLARQVGVAPTHLIRRFRTKRAINPSPFRVRCMRKE